MCSNNYLGVPADVQRQERNKFVLYCVILMHFSPSATLSMTHVFHLSITANSAFIHTVVEFIMRCPVDTT